MPPHDEALARIRRARETHAQVLDLGDLLLETLPEELGSLTALRALGLGGLSPTWDEDGKVRWHPGDERRRFWLPLRGLGPLARLTSLTQLDLSICDKLTDLGPLAGRTSLTLLGLGGCTKVTDLAPLAGLTSLAVLNLSRCKGLTDLGPLAGLASLDTLDLSGCDKLTDLRPLAGLTSLTALGLSGCGILTDLAPLAGLTSLTVLNLSGCKGLTDLNPLAKLTRLTSLNLSGCSGVTSLEPLRSLTSLSSVNLVNCDGLTGVEPLVGLPGITSLTSLDLTGCERMGDVEPLRALTALTSLSLNRCQELTNVEPLRALVALTSLDLAGCGGLRDVEPLRGLVSLKQLDLSRCDNLNDVGPLRGLTSLTSLDVSGCARLTDLGPLRRLASLASLRLNGCRGVKDLGPLGELTGLTSLHLAQCGHLGLFEPLAARLPSLAELNLEGTTFRDLAPEVYAVHHDPDETRPEFDNVIDRVRAHYADFARGEQYDTEIKVFVLGNGGVGKSHLCNRLTGGEYPADPASIPSTHGIRITEFDFDVEAPRPARLNLWDFGGQEIYHGSHALFLQQRAVYLLLWAPDREGGEFHDGVAMRHRPLAYWLEYVRNVAGPEAPVLIIQSQCDSDEQVRPPPCPLPDDIAFVRVLEVSSKTGLGLKELRGALAGAVERVFRKRLPKMGVGRAEVRRRLRELSATRRTLTVDEFRDLCAGGPEARPNGRLSFLDRLFRRRPAPPPPPVSDPDAFLSFLHECGVVFHKSHLFGGRVILDQSWALEAIYTLLDRGKTLPALHRHGRFTRDGLKALVWRDKTDADCDTLIDMMRGCGICFEVRKGEYVAPELLPPYSDALGPMLASLRNNPNHLGFVVEYPFLHDGILRGFLSLLGRHTGSLAIYWKYGCWFRESRTACDVIVESASDGSRGGITVRAWGRDAEGALRSLLRLTSDHRLTAPPRLRFLNFAGFDGRGEAGAIQAGPPDPAGVGKQVYLSYAWGEDTTEVGRLRERAARRTIELLTEAGYAVTYDRKDMRLGDLISAFICRIGGAPDVVTLLSRKYLESPYCVKELYFVFLSALRDRRTFLRRVHPIPLADAGLADRQVWRAYKKHWEEKKAEMEELFPHGSDGGVLTSLEISHWLLDLTTVLSHLSDTLSPPVPDEDLDALIMRALAMLSED